MKIVLSKFSRIVLLNYFNLYFLNSKRSHPYYKRCFAVNIIIPKLKYIPTFKLPLYLRTSSAANSTLVLKILCPKAPNGLNRQFLIFETDSY